MCDDVTELLLNEFISSKIHLNGYRPGSIGIHPISQYRNMHEDQTCAVQTCLPQFMIVKLIERPAILSYWWPISKNIDK